MLEDGRGSSTCMEVAGNARGDICESFFDSVKVVSFLFIGKAVAVNYTLLLLC